MSQEVLYWRLINDELSKPPSLFNSQLLDDYLYNVISNTSFYDTNYDINVIIEQGRGLDITSNLLNKFANLDKYIKSSGSTSLKDRYKSLSRNLSIKLLNLVFNNIMEDLISGDENDLQVYIDNKNLFDRNQKYSILQKVNNSISNNSSNIEHLIMLRDEITRDLNKYAAANLQERSTDNRLIQTLNYLR